MTFYFISKKEIDFKNYINLKCRDKERGEYLFKRGSELFDITLEQISKSSMPELNIKKYPYEPFCYKLTAENKRTAKCVLSKLQHPGYDILYVNKRNKLSQNKDRVGLFLDGAFEIGLGLTVVALALLLGVLIKADVPFELLMFFAFIALIMLGVSAYLLWKLFLKRKKGFLNRALSKYLKLFSAWSFEYKNDGSVDECRFTKDEFTVIFSEDLREHITNFYVLSTAGGVFKVENRKCCVFDESLNTEGITADLRLLGDENNQEKREISAYVAFLKINNII